MRTAVNLTAVTGDVNVLSQGHMQDGQRSVLVLDLGTQGDNVTFWTRFPSFMKTAIMNILSERAPSTTA
jgi:hypothetical protein